MGDHTPIADKIDAEMDSLTRLWRKRGWLAVTLVIGVVFFVGWTLYSKWVNGKNICKLENENSRLESALREAERENRGLRETVAPLLARAAREFPGEEINLSLKKLLEQLEADRPSNKPLASASMTVQVVIDSSAQVNNYFMNKGGYAAFCNGQNALMLTSSNESFGNTISTKEVRYRAVFQMPADDKMVGRPLRELLEAEYLQIEFLTMDENQTVKYGHAIVVLNDGFRVEFDIPPQISQGRRIFVRDVQDRLRSLLQ